jgi:hypothetical protein
LATLHVVFFGGGRELGLIKLRSVRLITNYNDHYRHNASIIYSVGDFPDVSCPKGLENEVKQFVREMIPELADQLFVNWMKNLLLTPDIRDGMATDLNFCIFPNQESRISSSPPPDPTTVASSCPSSASTLQT